MFSQFVITLIVLYSVIVNGFQRPSNRLTMTLSNNINENIKKSLAAISITTGLLLNNEAVKAADYVPAPPPPVLAPGAIRQAPKAAQPGKAFYFCD